MKHVKIILPIAVLGFLAMGMPSAGQGANEGDKPAASRSLEETRLTLGKWIETQQIISKERKDWQQGKEVLVGRVELVQKEIATLADKIEQVESKVEEAHKKRDELNVESYEFERAIAQVTEAVTGMEGEVRRLFRTLPEPIQVKLRPLHDRMPADPAETKASAAERFQNVLGILNELNRFNNEIAVSYEVHNLAGGKPSEVQAIYIGLAQAYYVSASGEAGIGRPGPDGWKWEPSKAVAGDLLMALEILQGKHTPTFVPLPVTIQ